MRDRHVAGRADAQPDLKFICRDIYLRVERSDTPFTRGYNAGQVVRVPVAHGEGNYIADGETIARLEGEGRVLFRYASPDGMVDPNWNHNGAINAIAGIVNERGNVLGMMPHPENHVEPHGFDRRPRDVCGACRDAQARGTDDDRALLNPGRRRRQMVSLIGNCGVSIVGRRKFLIPTRILVIFRDDFVRRDLQQRQGVVVVDFAVPW